MRLLIFVILVQRAGASPSASPPSPLPNAVPPSSEPSPSTGMALSPNSDCDDLPDRLVARFTEEVARGHQVSGCPQLQARGLCSHLAARGLYPATCSLCGANCTDVQAQNLTDATAGIGLQMADCQELLAKGAVPGRHRRGRCSSMNSLPLLRLVLGVWALSLSRAADAEAPMGVAQTRDCAAVGTRLSTLLLADQILPVAVSATGNGYDRTTVRRGRLLAAASYHLLLSDSTRAVAESTQVGEMHSCTLGCRPCHA